MKASRIQTFVMILIRDARVFKKHIVSRFIDACVWSSIVLFVSQYIMPRFGVAPSYGTFMMFSNIAAWGMFEVATNCSILISDLLGNQSISYYLTLPIPHNWIFIRLALMDAYKSFISTLPMIPVGKIVLYNQISLADIAYGKLIVSYILAHLFFGFFGLFLASITPNLSYITTIKLRIIFPMWFLGGYQFSWLMLYETNKLIAYLNLANPTVYIIEAMRAAVITDHYLIDYHICISMIVLFTIVFGYFGVTNFKKRLDCL